MLITIEGIDASGKATLSKALAQSFPRMERVAFPIYETELGTAILGHLKGEWHAQNTFTFEEVSAFESETLDQVLDGRSRSVHDARALQCMMTVNRYEAVPMIVNLMHRDNAVVFDRWWMSGVAYGQADGLDPDWLEAIHCGLPPVSLALLVDVPVSTSMERRPERRDRYEANPGFLEQVRKNYQSLWTRHMDAGHNWVVLDGTQTPEQVLEQAVHEVRRTATQAAQAFMDAQKRIITPDQIRPNIIIGGKS